MTDFGCPEHLEKHRKDMPGYEDQDKQNGALDIREMGLRVVFSNGAGWEHLSVSRNNRTPSYEDLEWLKQQFWGPDVTVMQLHVPGRDHINCHDHCLHLWRPIVDEKMECPDCGQTPGEIPRPPVWMVGPKG